ncbi:MAG: magnesium chelatase ATPase subunit D [Chloroherpetonaceae bacterium]|nr:magnesium chelatase ATPase subunit D [Chloroherpetonaceae bacterium]MDW8438434.1 magnesium chelatase ATPase subunit D [Chloroherpetonaceae bacterium]
MLSFTNVLGLELAKKALLLVAVDSSLGGVLIPATVGSGKSTLARAFARILPEGTPFVELPLNVTEDRLLGGLDLEVALATGKRVIEKGLLAKAHNGVLYVDSFNLLDSASEAHLIDAMSRGQVLVERDGASEAHDARFILVGTYNPAEGDVRKGLLDRIGLIAPFEPTDDEKFRAEVVRRVDLKREADEDGDALLRGLILQAREALPRVEIRDEEISGLVQTALALGVEGNRADVFAVKAALASAALAGRLDVDEDDLKLAARLVLLPRATRIPEREETERRPPPPPAESPPSSSQNDSAHNSNESSQEQTPDQIEELLLDAIEAELPENLMNLASSAKRRSKAGSRGEALNLRRGRYVRAEPGSLRKGKLALVPTLIQAAPFQRLRQTSSRRSSPLVISKDDIRIKRFRDKAGTLFIFIVDASGSMALNRMQQAKGAVAKLLQEAYVHRDQVALIAFRGKRAETLLPPSQSVDRAKRALDVLPTGGGTPLASAMLLGLETAKQMRAKGISQTMLVFITDGRGNVALAPSETDASDKQKIAMEISALAQTIRAEGIDSVVIDTQTGYLSRGEAKRLAEQLGGRYVYLPNAKAEQIASAVKG